MNQIKSWVWVIVLVSLYFSLLTSFWNYHWFDPIGQISSECSRHEWVNLSNAETTFGQSTRMQRFSKIIYTLSCWYSDTHWIALAEYSQMSTHVPRFQSFFRFLHHFVQAKLATSSIRVKQVSANIYQVPYDTSSISKNWWCILPLLYTVLPYQTNKNW